MKCVKCGHDVNDEFKFCNFCGSPMVKEIRCQSCKSLVPEGSKFCGLCGTPLKAASLKIKENSLKETSFKPAPDTALIDAVLIKGYKD